MDNINTLKIGVIGYGNFGKVICQYLFPNNKVLVYSRKKEKAELQTVSFAHSLKELVNTSDIVIPAVPIREFETVIEEISSFLKPDQVVMDICSVKEYPVEIMKKHLAKKTQVIASHPMFGPNSIKQSNNDVKDLNFVISNIGSEEKIYTLLKKHFTTLGLTVIEMTPLEHDRLSAHSQFFAMLVGQLAQKLNVAPTKIDTPGFAALFTALQYMGPDRHIIEDMITYNRYCKDVLKNMLVTLKELR